MYFKNINECLYFARALTDQPAVPNAKSLDNKFIKYVGVCKPMLVDPEKVTIY